MWELQGIFLNAITPLRTPTSSLNTPNTTGYRKSTSRLARKLKFGKKIREQVRIAGGKFQGLPEEENRLVQSKILYVNLKNNKQPPAEVDGYWPSGIFCVFDA